MIALAALGAVSTLFVLVTTLAILFRRRAPSTTRELPPVVLLRCTESVRPTSADRWTRDAKAYSGPLRRIVASAAGDPVEGAHAVRSGVAVNAVGNRKSLHLAIAHREAEALGWLDDRTIVVHADADVELQPGDLDRLVAATDERTAAFAAPAPRGGAPLAVLLARAIVTASPQAFAAIDALARLTGGAPALAGKLVAIPAPLLERIGGYESLVVAIGDDVALVDALAARGASVRMADVAAVTVDDDRTIASLAEQLVRWLRVASLHRPGLLWTYPTLVASLPLALLAAPFHPWAAWAALALAVSRITLGAVLVLGPYRGRSSLAALLVLPLADALLLHAALSAAGRRHITWAGRVYGVGPGGTIETVEIESEDRIG